MATIIASGTTALASADFTLAAGESTTLFITSAAGEEATPSALAKVQIKAGAAYTTVGHLRRGQLAQLLTGPGTFRVWRPVTSTAFAVERV